ncbi:MAG: ATP-binding protein, partial [Bradyrhizobium sp.]
LLDKIEAQSSRAGDVIRSLRALVKKHDHELAETELGELVPLVLRLVEMESRDANIHIESTIAPELPSIFVDGVQIQQVLLNLIRNAIESIEEAGISGGIIKVAVVGTAKSEIAVSVSDCGPGISPEVAGHIFDPFYSTKREGLGVGLSISRTIVEAHGGLLSLSSKEGGGCVFQFTLPVANRES